LGEHYRWWSSSLCSFLHTRYLIPLTPNYYPQHPILKQRSAIKFHTLRAVYCILYTVYFSKTYKSSSLKGWAFQNIEIWKKCKEPHTDHDPSYHHCVLLRSDSKLRNFGDPLICKVLFSDPSIFVAWLASNHLRPNYAFVWFWGL
jgi:hypothetical protein